MPTWHAWSYVNEMFLLEHVGLRNCISETLILSHFDLSWVPGYYNMLNKVWRKLIVWFCSQIIKRLYPTNHIAIGNELMKLASIQLSLNDRASALNSIKQAYTIFSLHYGSHMVMLFPYLENLQREAKKFVLWERRVSSNCQLLQIYQLNLLGSVVPDLFTYYYTVVWYLFTVSCCTICQVFKLYMLASPFGYPYCYMMDTSWIGLPLVLTRLCQP